MCRREHKPLSFSRERAGRKKGGDIYSLDVVVLRGYIYIEERKRAERERERKAPINREDGLLLLLLLESFFLILCCICIPRAPLLLLLLLLRQFFPLSLSRLLALLIYSARYPRPTIWGGKGGGCSIQWEKTATKMVAGWMGLIQIESSQRTSVEAEGE